MIILAFFGGLRHTEAMDLELRKVHCAEKLTFHSLRRSFATSAADNGATAQQMTDFYGWKSANMAQEYISTSKNAVNNMAALLKATGPLVVDGPGARPVEDSNDQLKPGSGVQLEQCALRSDSCTKKIIIHSLTINNRTTNFL